MSNQVYPVLPGLEFNVHRVPTWKTIIRTTPSEREYRTRNQVYPKRRRQLSYEFLRSAAAFAELQTMEGFYNLHAGACESFLFNDPDDNAVTAQVIGVGDGSNKDFPLARSWGGVVEPVAAYNSTPSVYKNGALQSGNYTLVAGTVYPLNQNVVRFNTAPASGVVVTWTGSYYWRTRFLRDELDFIEFLNQLWKTGQVDLLDTRT